MSFKSPNIAKLESSNKVEVQSSGGSKELIQASLQDEPGHKEQSEDDCTDEETFEEPSFVNGLQSFKISRRISLLILLWKHGQSLGKLLMNIRKMIGRSLLKIRL